MPWSVAAEPTGTWTGNCNQLDLHELIPEVPVDPGDFEVVSAYDEGDLHVLEGFELPDAAVAEGATSVYSVAKEVGSTYGISLSTTNRGSTITGGHSLRIVSDTTHSGTLSMGKGFLSPSYQYFRVYVYVESYTNGNGSLRLSRVGGWVDSTGYRSAINFVFPAAGGLKWGISNDVPGVEGGATGTTSISIETWYRLELVTESGSGLGMQHTLYVYLDDTDTLVETLTFSSVGIAAGGFAGVGTGTTNTGNAITYLVDDVRIQTSHATLAAFAAGPVYGPGGIWMMYPTSGTTEETEWTPLSGSNYANVDDLPTAAPDDDTSYVGSSGAVELNDVYRVAFHPDTVPDAKYIKAVYVNCRSKNVSGSAATTYTLYRDVLETFYAGKASEYDSGSYITWPGSSLGPYLFMQYTTGLRTELKAEQRIGVRRPTGSATSASRVTTVWGAMDVAAMPGE